MPLPSPDTEPFATLPAEVQASAATELRRRMAFVAEVARRLHQFGTAAPRLESAIDLLSARLALRAEIWSSPTALILSFSDGREDTGSLAEFTQVMRLSPGDIDLRRLVEVNEIADDVIAGRLNIEQGFGRLHAIGDSLTERASTLEIGCYGLVSAALAALLHSSWTDIVATCVIGIVVGMIASVSARSTRLRNALEAICAMLVTLMATLISLYVTPLTMKSVVLASLIVLLPGMSLTTAARELSTQHLVSGTARFAGAVTTLVKLAFGTIAANELCRTLHLLPPEAALAAVPAWVEWIALLAAAYAFAVLFHAARRDYLLVMAAAVLGYLITNYGGRVFAPAFGVFLGGVIMGALSNFYATRTNRPGALVREPGIILLVPGSVGYLSLSQIAEHDVFLGINTAVSVAAILSCLVAGLMFGDLVVAPRRSL